MLLGAAWNLLFLPVIGKKGKHMSKWLVFSALALVVIAGFAQWLGYGSFLSIEGLLIVAGGSILNAHLSHPREDVANAFKAIFQMLEKPRITRDHLHRDIMQLIRWSYVVQAEDLQGLEKESARKIHDPILRYGMDLVITGYPADKIRDMMLTVAESEFERHCAPVAVLRNMAATAPAFGMVGTLIGMITLMHSIGADISNIGSGLAIAMLATLYGLLVARLLCLPAADKLLHKEENVYFRNCMMTEGFVLLAEKHKPFYVQDKLNSFLEPSRHIDFDNMVHRVSRRQFASPAAA